MLLTAAMPIYSHAADVRRRMGLVAGPAQLSAHDTRVALLGATTVTGDQVDVGRTSRRAIQATLDTGPLSVGSWQVLLHLIRVDDERRSARGRSKLERLSAADASRATSGPIEVTPRPFAAGDDVGVTLKRAAVPPTADQALWVAIRNSTNAIGFENYNRFIEAVICGEPDFDDGRLAAASASAQAAVGQAPHRAAVPERRPVPAPEGRHRGLPDDPLRRRPRRLQRRGPGRGEPAAEPDGGPGDLEAQMREYLVRVAAGEGEFLDVLPYLGLIRRQLGDVAIVGVGEDDDEATEICSGILAEKLDAPVLPRADRQLLARRGRARCRRSTPSCWRFQNRTPRGRRRDPLAGLDIDPLRPVNNLLWGLVQDQQHRLTDRAARVRVRPPLRAARSRPSRARRCAAPTRGRGSCEAFHNLLALAAVFYTQDDDTTHIADGFPVLNALKETHLLLTEGAHNQYGDLPWTARHELLMYEWILSRREMRDFLPTRTMVAYAEPWMAPLEAMNKLLGWSDVSVMHFRDLAVFGEQLLLGIRFGAWSRENDQAQAANWVRYWRPEIQGYIHAYRAVAGVDLTRPAYGTRASRRGPAPTA